MGELGELNEISVAIGELRAEVKANRAAMSRVEGQLAEISKQLTLKHAAIDAELTKIKVDNAKQATIISAIVAGVVLFGKQIIVSLGGKL